MAKRFIDDGLFSSPSLAMCTPAAQDHFHRFLLLADDFGCFDANTRVLLGRGWPLRQDVTIAMIAGWLREFEAAGMAQLWSEGGRVYCFLTGWDGPKGQRKRPEYDPSSNPKGSKRRTPKPPAERTRLIELLFGEFPPGKVDFPPSTRGGSAPGEIDNSPKSLPAAESRRETQLPGGFPLTQSQSQSQSQSQISLSAPADLETRAAPPKSTGQGEGKTEDHASFRDKAVAVYRKRKGRDYSWGNGDHDLRGLQRRGTDEEILKRWDNALQLKFPTCNSLRDLSRDDVWNAAGEDPSHVPKAPLDVRRGMVRAEDQNGLHFEGDPF